MDEFEDATAKQYVIGKCFYKIWMDHMIKISIAGLKVDQEFPGIYEWHRVDTSANPDAASLAFSNWTPSENLTCIVLIDPQNAKLQKLK